jgi:hypothetical protein
MDPGLDRLAEHRCVSRRSRAVIAAISAGSNACPHSIQRGDLCTVSLRFVIIDSLFNV